MVGYNFIPLNIEAPVHKIFRRTFFWFLLIKNLIVCRELILKIDAAASSKFSGTKNVFHAPTDPTIDLIPILRTDIENNFAEPRWDRHTRQDDLFLLSVTTLGIPSISIVFSL